MTTSASGSAFSNAELGPSARRGTIERGCASDTQTSEYPCRRRTRIRALTHNLVVSTSDGIRCALTLGFQPVAQAQPVFNAAQDVLNRTQPGAVTGKQQESQGDAIASKIVEFAEPLSKQTLFLAAEPPSYSAQSTVLVWALRRRVARRPEKRATEARGRATFTRERNMVSGEQIVVTTWAGRREMVEIPVKMTRQNLAAAASHARPMHT